MREFPQPSNTLVRLSPGAKALYLGFLGMTLLGFASSVALYWDSMGFTPAEASSWYLGNMDDPDAADLVLEKSPRVLLEVAHFHLFTMPMLWLVLGHLFLLARGEMRWKVWVVAASGLFTLLHIAGPFAIHFGGRGLGWIMPVTGVLFVGLTLTMALWPIPDLLRKKPSLDLSTLE